MYHIFNLGNQILKSSGMKFQKNFLKSILRISELQNSANKVGALFKVPVSNVQSKNINI